MYAQLLATAGSIMHTESRSLIKSRTQSVNVDSLRKKMKTIPGKIWLSFFFLFNF